MNLHDAVAIINDMKKDGVIERYAIGGAIGAAFYIEPAETQDVDVFFSFEATIPGRLVDPTPIYRYLQARGAVVEAEYLVFAGWQVQFLTPKAGSIEEEALMRAVEKKVGDFSVLVFTAEHLAAIALQLGRVKDKIRLAQFAEAGVLDSAKFKAILQRHGLERKWDNFRKSLRDDA